MNKINFSLSPSSINLFNDSELLFYYSYVIKAKPDTEVVQCYGAAGNVVHEVLEEYIADKTIDIEKLFEIKWEKKKLFEFRGMNGRPLSYQQYLDSVMLGKKLLDTKYKDCKSKS